MSDFIYSSVDIFWRDFFVFLFKMSHILQFSDLCFSSRTPVEQFPWIQYPKTSLDPRCGCLKEAFHHFFSFLSFFLLLLQYVFILCQSNCTTAGGEWIISCWIIGIWTGAVVAWFCLSQGWDTTKQYQSFPLCSNRLGSGPEEGKKT